MHHGPASRRRHHAPGPSRIRRRARISVVAVAAAVLVPGLVVAAGSPAQVVAAVPAAVTDLGPVDAQIDLPDPPANPLADGLVLRSDDLHLSQGSTGQPPHPPASDPPAAGPGVAVTGHETLTMDPSVAGVESSSGVVDEVVDPLVTPNHASASGRLLAGESERVLAFRQHWNGTAASGSSRFVLRDVTAPTGPATAQLAAVTVDDAGPGRPFPHDVAVGDLDGLAGDDGSLHDEAVVAWAGLSGTTKTLNLRVVDYRTDGAPRVVSPTVALPEPGAQIADELGRPQPGHHPGSVGVGIGDLDGDGRNEIVLTWQDASRWFRITVLRYVTDGADRRLEVVGPVEGHVVWSDAREQFTPGSGISITAGMADTAVGDFVGAGRAQVAVAFATSGSNRSIPSVPSDFRHEPHLGLASFSSDLSRVEHQHHAPAPGFVDPRAHAPGQVALATYRPHAVPQGLGTIHVSRTWNEFTDHGLQLQAGLLRVDDPPDPTITTPRWSRFGVDRRQLAMAYTLRHEPLAGGGVWGLSTRVDGVSVSGRFGADGSFSGFDRIERLFDSGLGVSPEGPMSIPASGHEGVHALEAELLSTPLRLAVGAFQGVAQVPTTGIRPWRVALAHAVTPEHRTKVFTLEAPDPGWTTSPRVQRDLPNGNGGARPSVQLTATDLRGHSVRLGAPAHITVEGPAKLTALAAQPPVHADWVDGQFVNVSRDRGFTLTLGTSQSRTYQHTVERAVSHELGLSGAVTVGGSVGGGLLGAQARIKGGFEASLAHKLAESTVSTEAYNFTRTVTLTSVSDDDDALVKQIDTSFIYRYPVFGKGLEAANGGQPIRSCGPNGDEVCHGYYDIVVPGDTDVVLASGSAVEDYQPTWQNGNVLSYPRLEGAGGSSVPIDDLGSYSFVDEHGGQAVARERLASQAVQLGRSSHQAMLRITSAVDTSHARSTQSTWHNGQSFRVSAKVGFSLGGDADAGDGEAGGGEASGGGVGVGFKASIAGSREQNETISAAERGRVLDTSGTDFTLDVPALASDSRAYNTGSAYYYSDSGTPTVAHGVDVEANPQGRDWWRATYGGHDAALNLPNAMFHDGRQMRWRVSDNRQRLRGFWVLQPEDPSSPLTSLAPYATNPVAGDRVVFATDVHNYGLSPLPASVTVDFFAVPLSADGLKVVGEPVRVGARKTTDAPIAPQGHVEVHADPWTSTRHAAGGSWRIFVVVDADGTSGSRTPRVTGPACPADSLDPLASAWQLSPEGRLIDPMTGREETWACGQNKQGFGLVTVAEASAEPLGGGGRTASGPAGTGSNLGQHVSMRGFGLVEDGAWVTFDEQSAIPTVVAGQEVDAALLVEADGADDDHQQVLVYEGDPASGRLVASTKVRGTEAGVNVAAFTWRPTEPGLHELYQVVFGDDVEGERVAQVVRIQVVAPEVPGKPDPAPPAERDPAPPSRPGASGILPVTGAAGLGWLVGSGVVLLAGGVVAVGVSRVRRR